MKVKNVGKLEYLVAENISAPHGFTTRFGGVSSGYLDSLNIGTRRGDDPQNVLKNYEILGQELGFVPEELVLTRQTHTDIVLAVDESHKGSGLFLPDLPECDGLITNTPGVGLVVFTADCTPILLWDKLTGAVGAVHAGWRGTAAQIGAKAVKMMEEHYGSRPEDICAAIGPNIGPCCFETDADVPEAMIAAFGEEAKEHIRQKGEKYYVNLKELNALSLRRAGVQSIEISKECTACRPDKFWSHRRVGSERGSQGAIIVCR
ncbi:MAG: peptidoglycan editing factor PgeF [Oscillospiraceae bacterium]|nr:peptidoglycan editing factor PgeF [Oscillospiraceae bacterium]